MIVIWNEVRFIPMVCIRETLGVAVNLSVVQIDWNGGIRVSIKISVSMLGSQGIDDGSVVLDDTVDRLWEGS
jgi:hypothetical protein